MSTETASRAPDTNGSASPTFVKRVIGIPVVAEGLNTAYSTIQANQYSAAVYTKAEGAAQYLYEQSKPLQDKLAGPIGQVDGLANKGLDFVQARAPYVFEANTNEIISKARQPADQAYAFGKTYTDAASARLSATTEQFTSRLAQSQSSLAALQEKLSAAVRDPKSVQEQLKTLSEQVVAEVEKLSNFVGEKRKELPQQAQQAVAPLVEKLQTSFTDIKAELTKADTPLTTRATNVLQYSREHASPIVHEALQTLQKMIGKADKKGDEAAGEVKEKVDETKAKVNGN